jgi:hypothetical protein
MRNNEAHHSVARIAWELLIPVNLSKCVCVCQKITWMACYNDTMAQDGTARDKKQAAPESTQEFANSIT